jgi:GntR family transcriptional regulator
MVREVENPSSVRQGPSGDAPPSHADEGRRVRLLLAKPPKLDRAGGLAVHVQIEQWLTAAIAGGVLVTGDRLPPERELSARLGVSRMTLRQGVEALERRGVVTRVPGRDGGAFVTEPRVECELTGLPGFSAQVRRTNLRPGSVVLSARQLRCPADVQKPLRLEPPSKVYEIIRVRLANETPLAIERSYFPAKPLPGWLDHDLTGSLYDLLAGWGLDPETAVEYLEPTTAGGLDAELLQVPAGSPLMEIERTAFARGGVPVEFSRDLFRPDRVRLMVRSRVGGDAGTGGVTASLSSSTKSARAQGRG